MPKRKETMPIVKTRVKKTSESTTEKDDDTEEEEEQKNELAEKISKTKTNTNLIDYFTIKPLQSAIDHIRKNVCSSVNDFNFNKTRVRSINHINIIPKESQTILYWMSRDQRVQDNWAMLYAQRLALKQQLPLHVAFCLVPTFLVAPLRAYRFMLKGLREVEKECQQLNIIFHLLIGQAENVLPKFTENYQVGTIVTDFAPLRVPRQWVENVGKKITTIPIVQVDAHNVVPCWHASSKLEYAARTIRNKLHQNMNEFFTEYPPVIKHPHTSSSHHQVKPVDWQAADDSLQVDRTVNDVAWAVPGYTGGITQLESFINERVIHFAHGRNDPNKTALSNLSPWLHYGQISPQRALLIIAKLRSKYKDARDSFIEEAFVRRELADNFCYYQENYDNINGAWDWAKKTLNDHRNDKRTHVYTRDDLEYARTYDKLWNASQIQMIKEGKMHGFLRMYWAKKILEWTKTPEEALEIAIYLNDKYNLDGRDPNGYVGIMWSICGVHDQGWRERPVFGKIRYMNYEGCKRKFDVSRYENKYSSL
jgi:deoxyribodipyrimidine photo-lyase